MLIKTPLRVITFWKVTMSCQPTPLTRRRNLTRRRKSAMKRKKEKSKPLNTHQMTNPNPNLTTSARRKRSWHQSPSRSDLSLRKGLQNLLNPILPRLRTLLRGVIQRQNLLRLRRWIKHPKPPHAKEKQTSLMRSPPNLPRIVHICRVSQPPSLT